MPPISFDTFLSHLTLAFDSMAASLGLWGYPSVTSGGPSDDIELKKTEPRP